MPLISYLKIITGKCFFSFFQTTVPQYNPSAIRVPVALYWGGNDWLADPDDVKILMQKLPNKWYDKYIQAWEHLDFIWGLDAGPLVYDDVINRIIKIENGSWPADLESKQMKRSYCAFKVGIQIQDLQLFEYYIILLCCQYLSWPRSREREEYFSWLKRLCPLGVGCCCKLIMTESSTCH